MENEGKTSGKPVQDMGLKCGSSPRIACFSAEPVLDGGADSNLKATQQQSGLSVVLGSDYTIPQPHLLLRAGSHLPWAPGVRL